MDPSSSRWPMLGRLKRAVKKLSILLAINSDHTNRSSWRLASIIQAVVPIRKPNRQLSFDDRPGLIAYSEIRDSNSVVDGAGEGASSSPGTDDQSLQRTVSSPISNQHLVQRTLSFPMEDDIDKRAEMFIADFYNQLRLQRQISLQLPYRRADSFDSSLSPTSSPSPP
ncbi:hypothetical protein Dimus_025734 [Dionaea muscipula]